MGCFFSLGYPEIVFLLLNAGLDPKQKDSYAQVSGYSSWTFKNDPLLSLPLSLSLQTPMHSACIKGDIQVAEMLLEHVRD